MSLKNAQNKTLDKAAERTAGNDHVSLERNHQMEQPVPLVRGTVATSGDALIRSQHVAERLSQPIELAGYEPIQTPGFDLVELHERKSGAAITTRILEIGYHGDQGPICLRPELTVGVVRSVIESGKLANGPVRVSVTGSVYRLSGDQAGGLNQIDQIGVELVGDASVEADAEVIALADAALRNAGVTGSTIQLGDVGLILEAVTAAGLPAETRKAIVETLADAAASGKGLVHVENALEHWADWLGDQSRHKTTGQSVQGLPGHDLQRLFHHLVPEVVGRRTESDILGRLQQKWAMAERLPDALTKAARLVHELGGLAGEPAQVFAKLKSHPTGSLAEKSRQRLGRLVDLLTNRYGIEASRIRIDLGVARGIGFYSGLTFSFHGAGAKGVELAGGGRYDGLVSVLGLSNGPDYGVGFAIGLERVIQSVGQSGVTQTQPVYVLQPHDESVGAMRVAIRWIENLRSKSHRARLATPADQADASGQILIEVSADGEAQCADSRQLVEFNQKLTAERLIES